MSRDPEIKSTWGQRSWLKMPNTGDYDRPQTILSDDKLSVIRAYNVCGGGGGVQNIINKINTPPPFWWGGGGAYLMASTYICK